MQPSTLAKRGNILLFIVVIGFYFYGLGHLPLVGPDEPRYAEVAREMFVRRDLITPTLGGHLWFEKPALLYWMMIASFKLFGVSEWSARLPGAVSGLLTILGVFWIARHAERSHSGEAVKNLGFYSSLVCATSLGIAAFSRAASFDIILTMTVTWALGFFIVYELGERERPQELLIGLYGFVGLALLAKGLVGIIIPAGVIAVYYVFRRRFPERKTLSSLIWGVPLTLAVAATWYAPVIWRHGWPFIDQFFIQHHFARYVTTKYHHTQPAFYYLVVLPLVCLPWTAFLIGGLVNARRWQWRRQAHGNPVNNLRIFALAWVCCPLIFFSFSNSKLPGYILPVLPAAALIIGEQISRLASQTQTKPSMIRATAALCFLCSITGAAYGWRYQNLSGAVALIVAIPLVLASVFALLLTRHQSIAVILIGAATMVSLISVLHFAAPQRADYESTKRLLELADSKGYSQAAIYGMQRQDRTPEFYAAGRITYGPDGEPIMYEGAAQVIAESQKRNEVILAFVPLKDIASLSGSTSAQTEVIGSNGRFAIVAIGPH